MKTLIAILFSALTAAAQVELSGGLEVSGGVTLGQEAAAAPAGEGSPEVLVTAWATNSGTVSSLSTSNITVSGSGKLILATIGWYAAGVTISGVQWGAEDFTERFATNFYDGTGKSSVWSLTGPTDATDDITVTFSGNTAEASVSVAVLTNAHQTFTFGTWEVYCSASPGTSNSLTISGAVGDYAFNTTVWDGSGITLANGADETLLVQFRHVNKASGNTAGKVFDATTEDCVVSGSGQFYRTQFAVPIKKP